MNPTILEGDFVFSNLLSYGLRVPMTDFRIAQWDNSKESRIFGVVQREKIVGEATRVVMSFDKPDYFQPQWGRFFRPLK